VTVKTHHRLVVSIIAIATGILLMINGSGISSSAGMYMAFGGIGIAIFGMWQLGGLLQNRQRTWRDLVSWAEQEYTQAVIVGLVSITTGAIVLGSLLWSWLGVMQTGSSITVRSKPIGFGIAVGGVLVWLGAMLIRVAIRGKSNSD
jgi:hypothetical protein